MFGMNPRARLRALLAGVSAALLGALGTSAEAGQSFTTLSAGFTQELYGIMPRFAGGVAFAGNGNPYVESCSFASGAGAPLTEFEAALLPPVNGTSTLHSSTDLGSNLGCGLAGNADGTLYANTRGGVINLDPATGAIVRGPSPVPGNGLGIATDPVTGDLVYVGADETIWRVNTTFTSTTVFSTALTAPPTKGLDGIAFDPTGKFLFVSVNGLNEMAIINRAGALVQTVPLVPAGTHPDGIAFHAASPQFVITNNNEGTITRFDFPGNDFTTTPTQSIFASGGFRGDLGQVGPDGCFYGTQNATRYDNGVVDSGNNSIVKICPGFSPPLPERTILTAAPELVQVLPGLRIGIDVSALLTNSKGAPLAGETIVFTAAGQTLCTAVTDASGVASCSGAVNSLLLGLLGLGYNAAFAGAGNLLPSSDHAALIAVGGIGIP